MVHCGACGSSTGTGGASGGKDWVMVMIGWVLGDGGSAGGGDRAKNWVDCNNEYHEDNGRFPKRDW